MTSQQTMQALLFTDIKEHQLVTQPIPELNGPEWALLKVRAVGVCGSDLHGYLGHTGRRIPPLVMGHEVAAEVVAMGDAVDNVKLGDRVALLPVYDQGQHGLEKDRIVLGMNAPGANAEYLTWPAENLFHLPDTLSDEAASLAEPLAICTHAVGIAHIRPFDTVFIVGAGPIGLLTLALLRNSGAGVIAISDTSDVRLEQAERMGATVLINPLRDDPRTVVDGFTGGQGVDIAFEAVGMTPTCQQTLAVTRDRGQVIWIGNSQRMVEVDMQMIVTRELRVLGSYGMTSQDFSRSVDMLADGVIPADLLINRKARLDEGVELFDELLASPEIIKCVIDFS